MIYFGEIRKFDSNKGFGFIVPNRIFSINKRVKQKDLFFHKSDLVSLNRIPFLKPGDKVSYKLGTNENNLQVAKNVVLVS